MTNGFNYEEFDQMVLAIEKLGADVEGIAQKVVNAGTTAALPRYLQHVPKGERSNPLGHARDNIRVSAPVMKKDYIRSLITFRRSRPYLYALNHMESIYNSWISRAEAAALEAAEPAMIDAFRGEIEDRL